MAGLGVGFLSLTVNQVDGGSIPLGHPAMRRMLFFELGVDMKASELIESLARSIRDNGDNAVVVYCNRSECYLEVDEVTVESPTYYSSDWQAVSAVAAVIKY